MDEQYISDVVFLKSMVAMLPEDDVVNLLLDPVELRRFVLVMSGS
jgi:hypothetical protein